MIMFDDMVAKGGCDNSKNLRIQVYNKMYIYTCFMIYYCNLYFILDTFINTAQYT